MAVDGVESGRTSPWARLAISVLAAPPFDPAARRPASDTTGPYSFPAMNEALVQRLASPEAPTEVLAVEDFLRRPEWHQQAKCRGRGPNEFVRAPRSTCNAVRELCETCPVRQE